MALYPDAHTGGCRVYKMLETCFNIDRYTPIYFAVYALAATFLTIAALALDSKAKSKENERQ